MLQVCQVRNNMEVLSIVIFMLVFVCSVCLNYKRNGRSRISKVNAKTTNETEHETTISDRITAKVSGYVTLPTGKYEGTPTALPVSKKVVPISVNYHFTRQCNYKCGFCFHTAKTSFVLPLDMAKRGLVMLHAAGMAKINFSGGEPFLVKRGTFLGELVRYCKETLQLPSVSVVSNGSLINESWFVKYGEYLDILAVSCDSFDPDTNELIGRQHGQKNHLESLRKVRNLCTEYKVAFKLNTVVNTYNKDEDMSDPIDQLDPCRWKVFQCLLIDGENSGSEAIRNAETYVITDEEFAAYIERHKAVKSLVPESNEKMQNSYLILDEYMRFLDCTKGSKDPSRSLLDVGVDNALSFSGFDERMFFKRGGKDLLPAFGKNETYDPIVFEILDISNALFDGAVELYVGTQFQISVRLEDDRVYKGVRFESCTANNTHLDNMLTYELFKNGCPTNQGKRTTKGQADHPTDPGLGKVILVVAFKFVNSKSIGLKCDITVCTEAEDAACKAPTDVECDNIRKNQDTIPTEDPEHPVGSPTDVPETTAEITTTFENSTDAEATPTENPADTTELSAENPTTVEHPTDAEATPTENPATTELSAENPTTVEQSTDAEVPPTENPTTAENPTDTLLPTVENPTYVTEHQTENPTTAENPTEPSLKRRRRAAGDDKNRTVSTVITVLGPQEYTSDIRKATPVDSTVDDCLARSEILAVLVVLASTVCILLIACFALASVVVRKRSKKNMFEPATCINLDRFQIPRAHVNEAFREI